MGTETSFYEEEETIKSKDWDWGGTNEGKRDGVAWR